MREIVFRCKDNDYNLMIIDDVKDNFPCFVSEKETEEFKEIEVRIRCRAEDERPILKYLQDEIE